MVTIETGFSFLRCNIQFCPDPPNEILIELHQSEFVEANT